MIATLLLLVPILGTYPLARAGAKWVWALPLWAAALAAPLQLHPFAALPRWAVGILAASLCAKSLDVLRRRPDGLTPGRYLLFCAWPLTLTWNRAFRRRDAAVIVELWRAPLRFGAGLGLLYLGALWDLDRNAWLLSHAFKILEIWLCIGAASDLLVGLMALLGYRIDGIFRNILRSRSVLDFWSRLDVMVHLWLKDHVYQPAGGRRMPARGIVASFLYSAVLHEYIFWAADIGLVGMQTLFFGMQALAAILRLPRWALWPFVFASTTVFMVPMEAVAGEFHRILTP
ncbi:MAG: MBOAT family protein [Planctomycetota bacterium]|nr:MBOAT family protein [Planctomycetota bacterium]